MRILTYRGSGEVLTSDLDSVLTDLEKLTKSGRYRPNNVGNRLPGLFTEINYDDSRDVYREDSPEALVAGSKVTRGMVREQLREDRAAADEERTQLYLNVQQSRTQTDGNKPATGEDGHSGEDAEGTEDLVSVDDSTSRKLTIEQVEKELRLRYMSGK